MYVTRGSHILVLLLSIKWVGRTAMRYKYIRLSDGKTRHQFYYLYFHTHQKLIDLGFYSRKAHTRKDTCYIKYTREDVPSLTWFGSLKTHLLFDLCSPWPETLTLLSWLTLLFISPYKAAEEEKTETINLHQIFWEPRHRYASIIAKLHNETQRYETS